MASSSAVTQEGSEATIPTISSPIMSTKTSKFRSRPRSSEFYSGSLPEQMLSTTGETTDNTKWRNTRDRRLRQPPTSTSSTFPNAGRNRLSHRRRLREKRRSPGANNMPSTEGTSTGEEESDAVFAKDLKAQTAASSSKTEHTRSIHHQHFRNHANPALRSEQLEHAQLSKRLSPANALLSCRFRGSKSQSDLDADCEDNTADYDSASMISASETGGCQSQFFIPDPSVADRNFQAHVQEIRVAGMQQLTASGGPQTDDDQFSASSSDDMEEDLGKILEKERREKSTLLQQLGQQEDRIAHLERVVSELTKRLQESCLENQSLKASLKLANGHK